MVIPAVEASVIYGYVISYNNLKRAHVKLYGISKKSHNRELIEDMIGGLDINLFEIFPCGHNRKKKRIDTFIVGKLVSTTDIFYGGDIQQVADHENEDMDMQTKKLFCISLSKKPRNLLGLYYSNIK